MLMSDKGNWPKSYLIPSILLSVVAAILLVLHLVRPDIKVDAWTVTLFVVGFLPWLRTVFESIGFPGGANIKFRELEARQERQAEEIQALQFLLARYITDDEKQFLRSLVAGDPLPVPKIDLPYAEYWELLRIGILAYKPNLDEIERHAVDLDFKDVMEVTDLGRRYLELLESLPADSANSGRREE